MSPQGVKSTLKQCLAGKEMGAGGAILGRMDREGLSEEVNLRRQDLFKFRGKGISGKKT